MGQGQGRPLGAGGSPPWMRANKVGWPTFNGKFVNHLWFKKEWCAYRRTYHNIVGDYLVAKNLKVKCANDNLGN